MSASLAYAMGINHLCPFNNNHIGLLYIEFFSLKAFSHKLLSHSHAIAVGPSRHSSAKVSKNKKVFFSYVNQSSWAPMLSGKDVVWPVGPKSVSQYLLFCRTALDRKVSRLA